MFIGRDVKFMVMGDIDAKLADCDGEKKIFFFIKENSARLRDIGNAPIVQSKSLIFETEGGTSMLMLFRFNHDDDYIYTKWFNFAVSEDHSKLEMLLFEQNLNFCMLNEEGENVTAFACENKLKGIIKDYLSESRDREFDISTVNDFITSVEDVYENRVSLFHESKYYIM